MACWIVYRWLLTARRSVLWLVDRHLPGPMPECTLPYDTNDSPDQADCIACVLARADRAAESNSTQDCFEIAESSDNLGKPSILGKTWGWDIILFRWHSVCRGVYIVILHALLDFRKYTERYCVIALLTRSLFSRLDCVIWMP